MLATSGAARAAAWWLAREAGAGRRRSGMDAEVAVIGTGTMGSMTLWNLARAGIPAIGFEQYTLGHDRSAAGGESRIFRVAYREGPQYVPMLLRARDLWRELEAEAGRDLLTVTGGLMIGDAGSG